MNVRSSGSGSRGTADGAQQITAHSPFRKWAVFFLIGLPLLLTLWLISYAVMPAVPHDGQKITVVIPAQTGFIGIKNILTEAGVVRDDIRFAILARVLGSARGLKAGEYVFHAGLTPYQVLNILEKGKVVLRTLTIPEGSDIRRIADILAADGWVDRDRFLDLTKDVVLIKKFQIEAESLEGYLFPDTYYLTRENQNETGIIGMMVERFLHVYGDIRTEYGKDISMSRHEIITLASIVEKETARPEERPLIAGVFLNRLEKQMRLQADPTVIFGLGDFSGNLTRKDLTTPSPYNTYMIKGLPPGPICSPGRAAIEAVLDPAQEKFLYFVSKNDGTHYFSRTLAEHNKAVAKYQK